MPVVVAVLVLYVLALLAIALLSYRKIKDHNDFFVAGGKGGFWAITGSLVATILGGSAIIGTVDSGPIMGWATAWFMICASLGLFALLPLVGKVKKLGGFTLPDLLENVYGTQTKNIASVIIPVAWLGIVAAQVIAAAKILQSFTGLSYEAGAIASGLVFILYTMIGGQFSVLKTDFVQAFFILAGLLLVAFFACSTGCLPVQEHVPLSFPFNINFQPFDLFILVIAYSTTFTAGPDIFSRIFSARNEIVARRGVLATAIILLPIALLLGFLSAYGAGCLPSPHKGAILFEISRAVLPGWAVPFIVLTYLSVVLSSADTTLLSASIILARLFKKDESSGRPVNRTRIIMLFFGLASIVIALNFTSIIQILLVALAVYSGAFFLPIIAGLTGFRVARGYISGAIIAGGAIALAGKIITIYAPGSVGNYIIVLAFMVNGALIFMGLKKQRSSPIIPSRQSLRRKEKSGR